MHPDLLKRIARWTQYNPGVGLPSDPTKLEEQLAYYENIEAQRTLLEYLGSLVVRGYMAQPGVVTDADVLEAATNQSNDLCAELDAYGPEDREAPMTLAGLIAQWLDAQLR